MNLRAGVCPGQARQLVEAPYGRSRRRSILSLSQPRNGHVCNLKWAVMFVVDVHRRWPTRLSCRGIGRDIPAGTIAPLSLSPQLPTCCAAGFDGMQR